LSIVNLKKNLVPSLIHSQLGTKENWNEAILLPFKTFLIILFYYDINEFPYTLSDKSQFGIKIAILNGL
jgi:hypothetical protein